MTVCEFVYTDRRARPIFHRFILEFPFFRSFYRMSNQPPPQMVNPGESQIPPYGHHPMGPHGGQGQPQHIHPGMMPMGPGMPYPPYMMFPMGGPYYMQPPHPDMGGQHPPPPEMQFGPPPPMMQMHYGYPPHPMGGHHPHMMPPPPQQGSHMNPNVAQFVPASHQQQQQPKPPAPVAAPRPPAPEPSPPLEKRTESPSPAAPAKPVSRRVPIIDPTTGQEISFKAAITPSSPPPSALTSADVVLGTKAPIPPLVVPPVIETAPAPAAPTPVPAVSESPSPKSVESPQGADVAGGKKLSKLKNAVLVKPKPVEVVSEPVVVEEAGASPVQRKVLKGIKNIPLVRKVAPAELHPSEESTPPLEASAPVAFKPKFKLTNKTLAPSTSSSAVLKPAAPAPLMFPIPREVLLRFMPVARPDRHAPSSINVFPSELLGLRTAPHGDPGLSAAFKGARRGGNISLQKTMSAVSTGSGNWRAGKLGGVAGGRGLTRQASRGGRVMVNQIIRPSERGFKIIDQSSLSEKDKMRRSVMSLLNKITVDSFQGITNQIAEIEITQPWQMDVVIGLIFDKAVVEHHYSELYADMCKKLRNTWPELTGVDQETGQSVPVTFTRAIIEKCQVEFDAIPDTLETTEADLAKARGNLDDLEIFKHKKKERILGNMKFIAQLFLMRILSSRVVRSVVEQLLFRTDEPEEHYIECIGILLHNIGATLMGSESGRAYVGQFVDRMKDLCTRECYGKRIKFLMKDVTDAAEAGWAGKHGESRMVTAAKSKEAVRKDAQEELKKKAAAAAAPSYPSSRYQAAAPRVAAPAAPFRPTVLRRPTETKQPEPVAKKEGDWTDEDEDEEDEVSEYAPSSDDEGEAVEESDDGFTAVEAKGRK